MQKTARSKFAAARLLYSLPLIFALLVACGVYARLGYPDLTGKLGFYLAYTAVAGFIVSCLANIAYVPPKPESQLKQKASTSPTSPFTRVFYLLVALVLYALCALYTADVKCNLNPGILYSILIAGSVAFGLAAGMRFEAGGWPGDASIRKLISSAVGLGCGVAAFSVVFFILIVLNTGPLGCWTF